MLATRGIGLNVTVEGDVIATYPATGGVGAYYIVYEVEVVQSSTDPFATVSLIIHTRHVAVEVR